MARQYPPSDIYASCLAIPGLVWDDRFVALHTAATNLENPMATVVDKAFLKTLRPIIDAALAPIAAAHGLKSLHLANGTFDPIGGTFVFKLEGVALGALGKDASRYVQVREMVGLPERGTTFKAGGIEYRTDGINAAGTKVVSQRVSDGKAFLIPTDVVCNACRAAVTS